MCQMIETLTNAIIRPSRYEYTDADLGPVRGFIRGVEVLRHDFEVSSFLCTFSR